MQGKTTESTPQPRSGRSVAERVDGQRNRYTLGLSWGIAEVFTARSLSTLPIPQDMPSGERFWIGRVQDFLGLSGGVIRGLLLILISEG